MTQYPSWTELEKRIDDKNTQLEAVFTCEL